MGSWWRVTPFECAHKNWAWWAVTDTASLTLDRKCRRKKEKSTTVSAAPLPHSWRLLPTFHCAALPLRVYRGQPCIKGLKAALTSPTMLEADQCESQQDQLVSPSLLWFLQQVTQAGRTTRGQRQSPRVRAQGEVQTGLVPALSQGTASSYCICLSTVRQRGILLVTCTLRVYVRVCVSDHMCTVTHINSV